MFDQFVQLIGYNYFFLFEFKYPEIAGIWTSFFEQS